MEEKQRMFANRLTKVAKHRAKIAARLGVSCFRLYDNDLPEFPFCIDLYGKKVYLAEYQRRHGMDEAQHSEWLEQSIETLCGTLDVDTAEVYVKERKRKENRLAQYGRTGFEKAYFPVSENGLTFLVNLSDYLDTGLFLDHRDTRGMVKERSEGKRVLNLFAYTGSFSVYAAAGRAKQVVTVDISNTYLDWARDNFEANGFDDPSSYQFVAKDVLAYIRELPKRAFDLIVMDPPTFSNSKKMKGFLDIQRDHAWLLNAALDALDTNGEIFFSTNFTKFKLDIDNIQAATIIDISKKTTPFDFEGKLKRHCFHISK